MTIGIPRSNNRQSFYRTLAWIVELRKLGHTIISFEASDRLSYGKCDIVFSHMLFGKNAERVIQIAKQMGCQLWIDIDDGLFHVPFSNASFEWHMSKERQALILSQADFVTCSTVPLKKQLENFLMRDVILLENYLWIEGFEKPKTEGEGIAWRGGMSHIEDFLFMTTALYDLEQEVDEMTFFGERPTGFTPSGKCKVFWNKHEDVWTYIDKLKKLNPRIMFCYLADIPFNTSKSDILWQEATVAGAVLVINKGWHSFDDKPCVFYDNEDLCDGVINALRSEEIDLVELWYESVGLMEQKRITREAQVNRLSGELITGRIDELKKMHQSYEIEMADIHPDVITDDEYHNSEGVTDDGDEQYDRWKVDNV